MKGDTHADFRFDSWQVFPSRNLLVGPPGEVHIEPKVMQVLVCLANNAGQVVSHETLLNKVWEGRAFSDEPLSRCIFELRRALGDSSRNPKYIETIPKSGYRLVPAIEALEPSQAWVPKGHRHRALATLLVLIFVAGSIVAYRSTDTGFPDSSPAVTGDTARVNPSGYSIAVLPFVNMSSEPEQDYFSDGLSEEVLNLLAKVPDLKVIGRTSSFAFKGKNDDPREVGATLGVETVLKGSVRKSGNRLRITAQLIDSSDGALIWSRSFERTMNEIFALQDDLAAAIIDALEIHISTNPTRGRPTDNVEAYSLFLKAKALINEQRWEEAQSFVTEAIDLDPEFARAHEFEARLHWNANKQQPALEAAAQALAINPDLILSRAIHQHARIGSPLAAIEAFEQASRRQPDDPLLMQAYAWSLVAAGYLDEAIALSRRMVDIDPLNALAYAQLAHTLYAIGQDSEAYALWDVHNRLSSADITWLTFGLLIAAQQDARAIAQLEAYLKTLGQTDTSWVSELVTHARDPAAGQAYLDRHIPELAASISDPNIDAMTLEFSLMGLYLNFGYIDRYMEYIYEGDPSDSRWTEADIRLHYAIGCRRTGFTGHPKFLELAEIMGLIKIWEERGPPDFCDKVDDQWVCE